jgi:hypothetical protein
VRPRQCANDRHRIRITLRSLRAGADDDRERRPERVYQLLPEPLCRMNPAGSGPHHCTRCPTLAHDALQHPGSWAGLVNLLRTTGSDARQPAAAARGRCPRHPRVPVDEWEVPAATPPAGATPHPAKPRVLGPRGAGRCLDPQTGSGKGGGLQIPLHPDATPLTVVDAERERLLCDAATLTGLGAFRRACGDAVNLPASTFSQTGQDLHQQPWRTTRDAGRGTRDAGRGTLRPKRRCHAR